MAIKETRKEWSSVFKILSGNKVPSRAFYLDKLQLSVGERKKYLQTQSPYPKGYWG